MPRTVLITAATGQVSSAVLEALEGADLELRVLVRDPAKAQSLAARGVEVVAGDLGDPRSLAPAFAGVHDLWLLTPYGPRAPEHSMNALWAARRAGVERCVRMSAVGAAHDAPTRSGRLHSLSDHELRQSGIAWTILRPLWFMQNLLAAAEEIAMDGTVHLNMGEGRLAMVDVRDIAALAAHILTSPPARHHAHTYTPTGPESTTLAEAIRQLGRAVGREIRYVPVSDEAAHQAMLDSGAPEWIAAMVVEYAQAYASGWGDFTTTDLQDVIGRRPRSIADFARDHAETLTAAQASSDPPRGI